MVVSSIPMGQMGALMYSAHFSSDNTTIEEVQEWNMFVGDNITMLKVATLLGKHGWLLPEQTRSH
jgi:hypothetical protein